MSNDTQSLYGKLRKDTAKRLTLTGHASRSDAMAHAIRFGFALIHRADGLFEMRHDDGRSYGILRRNTSDGPVWDLSDKLPKDRINRSAR